MGTGAVSRYKLITKLENCHDAQRLRACTGAESGWSYIRVMILKAGSSKTVTNKCRLLSVLADGNL